MQRTGQIMIDKFGRLQIKIYRETDNPLPSFKNIGDAGMDIRSNEDTQVTGFHWTTVGTGLFIIIPHGYEGQVRSRSGLAANFGLQVLNTPGTIDSGYRDELKVILINHSHWGYKVNKGDRIAQLVIKPVVTANMVEIDKGQHILESETENRGGGLGSTGVK